MTDPRYERRHHTPKAVADQESLWGADLEDRRGSTRRDHDRILYSTYLHRLADVTQIIREDDLKPEILLHNRLIHSLKAGELARTIAERIERPEFIDADAVHAACLAHDLGHPPYGHLGEFELHRLLIDAGFDEGFEGNAQAFRIVSKLACRHPSQPGLNLTRVTLNGLLKYPWRMSSEHRNGVYPTEVDELEWVRGSDGDQSLSPEAQISQWSDDVTYALHDLEDFYLVGLVPLTLIGSEYGLEAVIGGKPALPDGLDLESLTEAKDRLARIVYRRDRVDLTQPYSASRSQYGILRLFVSELLTRWLSGIRCTESEIEFEREHLAEILLIKLMVWNLVIAQNIVATPQLRERRRIRAAFRFAVEWMEVESDPTRLPLRLQEALNASVFDLVDLDNIEEIERAKLRAVRDFISGMTERQLRHFVASSAPALD